MEYSPRDGFSLSTTTMKEKSVRVIQITDCHLGPQVSESLLGLNTDQSLDDVLQLIALEQPEFDQMVCTGDIASAGHSACYNRFVTSVRAYFSAPLAWLPGNHDSAAIMANVQMSAPPEARQISLGKWLIVLLDSAVPDQVYGQLTETELAYLQEILAVNPDKHVMIMLHHQPVAVGSAWIDQYILRNAVDFFAIVDGAPQVKAIVWGHVHQDFVSERNGVQLIATPSTCVQFKPHCDEFTVDTRMPGYRWFDLEQDGSFKTGVSRVTGKQYTIDYKSAGY
jgi:Icc protein